MLDLLREQEKTSFPSRESSFSGWEQSAVSSNLIATIRVSDNFGNQTNVTSSCSIALQTNLRNGLFVSNNPVNAIDPLGLFNPSKGLSALGNAANAGRLYAGGALKLAGAAGLTTTGAGAPAGAGAGAAALGGWNLWSGQSAWNRSLQQWNEALNEDWSDASWKNLLGVLPFGTEFDDPCEPSPWEVLKDKANNFKDKPLEFIQEIGTLGF